jgi:hypothetical protein
MSRKSWEIPEILGKSWNPGGNLGHPFILDTGILEILDTNLFEKPLNPSGIGNLGHPFV